MNAPRLAMLALIAACSSSSPSSSGPPSATPRSGSATGSASAAPDKAKLREVVLAFNGHVTVLKMTAFSDYRDAIATAKHTAGVTSAEPFVFVEMTATSAAANTPLPIVVKGLEVGSAGAGQVEKRMIEGTTAALADHLEQPRVLLGRGLAKQLAARVGDEVTIAAAPDPKHPAPTQHVMRVAGIFFTGIDEYDNRLAIALLAAAQAMLGNGDSVTGLELRVSDIAKAGAVAATVEQALEGPPYRVMGWKELSPVLADP